MRGQEEKEWEGGLEVCQQERVCVCVCVCVCGCLSLPMDGCVTQSSPAGVFTPQHAAFVLFEK